MNAVWGVSAWTAARQLCPAFVSNTNRALWLVTNANRLLGLGWQGRYKLLKHLDASPNMIAFETKPCRLLTD